MGWVQQQFNNVSNTVNHWGNVASGDILQPIGNAVTSVVKGIEANPVKFFAQAALASNPATAWMVPVVEGIDVAAKGGNVEDVFKAAALSYVSQQAGQYVGSKVSGAVGKSLSANDPLGFNFDPAPHIAAAVAGGAARGATVAAITGQDPLKAMLTGGISAGVPAVLGSIDGFVDLKKSSPAAANAVQSVVTASLTGRDPSKALINSLITSSEIATKVIKAFDPKNGTSGAKMTPTQTALATDMLMGTLSAALTGGNASAAVQATLLNAGTKALGDMVKSKVFQEDTAKAAAAYKDTEAKAKYVNLAEAQYLARAEGHNTTLKEVNYLIDNQGKWGTPELTDYFLNKRNEIQNSDAYAAAYNARQVANTYKIPWEEFISGGAAAMGYNVEFTKEMLMAEELNRFYSDATSKLVAIQTQGNREGNVNDLINTINKTWVPYLETTDSKIKAIESSVENRIKNYESSLTNFNSITQSLIKGLEPTFKTVNQLTVEAIDPTFKADEYRTIAGLKAEDDPYAFFLKQGQFDYLPTNMKAAEAQIVTQRTRLVNDALKEQGQTLATADPKEVSKLLDNIDSYGNNLTALKAATIQDVMRGSTVPKDGTPRVLVTAPINYGAWNKPPETEFSVPAGMKLADQVAFKSGTAQQVVTAGGNHAWVVPDTTTIPKLWNPETGAADNSYFLPMVTVTAPKVTEEDKILAYAENPGVWEKYLAPATLAGAQAVVNAAKATGNSTLINTAANLVKAGGGFLETIGTMANVVNGDFKNNKFTQFAKALEDVGKAGNTQEYKDAISRVQNIIGQGKGFTGTLNAIWGGIKEAPLEFAAEYIGVEGMQEIFPYLMAGVVGTGAKGLAALTTLGPRISAALGAGAAATTGVGLNISEAAGGAAKDAYEETYRTAISLGKSESEADAVATKVATRAAIFAAGTTAISMGIAPADVAKAFSGKATGELTSAWQRAGQAIKDGTKVVTKETKTEVVEETLTKAFTLSEMLRENLPVTDIAGQLTSAAAFAAIATGPIAGSGAAVTKAGDFIAAALQSNPTIANTIATSTSAEDAEAKLRNFGITDKALTANVLNDKYDSQYTSSGEVLAEFAKQGITAPPDAEVTRIAGNTPPSQLPTAIASYIAEEDTKKAFSGTGYTPTDAEIKQFAAQADPATRESQIQQYAANKIVTEQEVRDAYSQLGLKKPTQEDVLKLVGQYDQSALESKATTNLDAARYNSVIAQLDNITAGADQATIDAIARVKEDFNQQLTKLGADVGQLSAGVNQQVSGVETRLNKAISDAAKSGLDRDAAITQAVNSLSSELGTTKEQLLRQLGTNEAELTKRFEVQVSGVETALTKAIDEAKRAGLEGDAALNSAINKVASDLGTTRTDLLTQLGTTETKLRQDLATQIGGVQTQLGNVETALTAAIAEAKRTGLEGDAALRAALDSVASDLGTTRTDLLTQLGTTETKLRQDLATQIGALTTDVQAKYDSLSAGQKTIVDNLTQMGLDLNTAIQTATQQSQQQLGALTADVQAKYDALSTQQKATVDALAQQGVDLNTAIQTATQQTQQQLSNLQNILGRPGAAVAQGDLDAVIGLLESQGAYDARYDYNGDKKIDDLDRRALENALRLGLGQNIDQPDFRFTPAAGSMWAPTGLFATQAAESERIIAAQAAEAEKTRQAQAAEAEKLRQEQINQANLTRQAQQAAALRTQRMGNINTMMGMLTQAPDITGQQVTVKPADPAKIGYMYDWSSIFANPAQEKMFVSPYAQGGTVQDVNDELLNILRG